jgi:CHAD domain-containing protein
MKKHSTQEALISQSVIKTINLLRQHLSNEEKAAEYIHRIRVDIKHLRAWLRLARRESCTQNWKHIDKRLSQQAKHLGLLRDVQAIRKTLNMLRHGSRSEEELSAIRSVKKKMVEKINNKINMDLVKDEISELLKEFEQDYTHIKSTTELKAGLDFTLKKIQLFGNKSFSQKGTYEDIHKLRKWIKHFYYQLTYLGWKLSSGAKQNLNKLGKELGNAHDLIVLKETLPQFAEEGEIEIINYLIDKEISLIMEASIKRYKKITALSFDKHLKQN